MFEWLLAQVRVGKRSQLRGLLECGNDALYVDGRYHGVIRSNSTVTIGPSGSVTGDIHARNVTIAGTVQGTVVARAKLRLRPSAAVDGDAYYQTLQVDKGGVIKGRTTKLDGKAEMHIAPSQHARDALAPSALRTAELTAGKSAPKKLPSSKKRGGAQRLSIPPVDPDAVSSGVTNSWPALDASAGERVLASNATSKKKHQAAAQQQKQRMPKAGKSGATTLPSSNKSAGPESERQSARETDRRNGRTTNPLGAMTPPPSAVSSSAVSSSAVSSVREKEAPTPTPRSGITTQSKSGQSGPKSSRAGSTAPLSSRAGSAAPLSSRAGSAAPKSSKTGSIRPKSSKPSSAPSKSSKTGSGSSPKSIKPGNAKAAGSA